MKVSGARRLPTSNPLGEIEHCCWPGCDKARYHEPDAPPLCGNHLVSCAVYITANMKDLLDPLGQDSPTVQPLRSVPAGGDPVVYYVRLGDHVKIGTTTNLPARLSSLYIDHDPSALLATEPGGRPIEAERHYQFAAERVYHNRELFNPSPRLLDHIARLNAEQQTA